MSALYFYLPGKMKRLLCLLTIFPVLEPRISPSAFLDFHGEKCHDVKISGHGSFKVYQKK